MAGLICRLLDHKLPHASFYFTGIERNCARCGICFVVTLATGPRYGKFWEPR